jgi:hypothetical protein
MFPWNVLPPSANAEMLRRRKFVVFVVRFLGCRPSRAAGRVQEILHILSQWKPFSGLRWWELLKLQLKVSVWEMGYAEWLTVFVY